MYFEEKIFSKFMNHLTVTFEKGKKKYLTLSRNRKLNDIKVIKSLDFYFCWSRMKDPERLGVLGAKAVVLLAELISSRDGSEEFYDQ